MSRQRRQLTRDKKRTATIVVAFATALCMWCATVPASAATPNEHTLKVAYLYNFTRYISWPDDTWAANDDEFVIGVLGENPFGQTLDLLAAKKLAKKRRIVVRYFKTLADYKHCHMLFVAAATDQATRAAVIRQTRGQPVLVVGESMGYCEVGSTINFTMRVDGSIRIEINIDAMNRRRMQASAMLLKLATIVRDPGAE